MQIDKTMIRIAYRFLRAKTPEERAHVDLDTHYTKVSFKNGVVGLILYIGGQIDVGLLMKLT